MSDKIKKLILIISTLSLVWAFFAFLPVDVQAQAENLWGGNDVQTNTQIATGLGNTDPRVVVANIIRIILGFLGIVAVVIIIYAGWLWMSSNGDEQKIDKAKKVLIAAIIGLILILSSFAIASYLLNKLADATGYGTTTTPVTPGGIPIIPIGAVSCDDNALDPTCNRNQSLCPSGQFCNTNCLCVVGGGLGASCDSVASTTACDADNNLCQADLHCDIGQSCTCQGGPIIDWISPVNSSDIPNGARGDLVTIGGRFFGTTTGEVYFSDSTATATILARLAIDVNPLCIYSWSDNQIVVEVPDVAAVGNGPIRVRRPDGEQDYTNDTRGNSIADFNINAVPRPGLCRLVQDHGTMGTTTNYYGIRLINPTRYYFGNSENNVPAINSTYIDLQHGTAQVPNLQDGRTTTFASSTGGQSNALYFTKESAAGIGPYITSFEPISGNIGQYVTIRGSGFGRSRGTNSVHFGNSTGPEASYDFPEICADSIWNDNQIIIKVPNGMINGNYLLTLVLGTDMIDTSNLTNNTFEVNTTAPLSPSLCKIEPTTGPNNSQISLYGEYFDSLDANSHVRFHLNHQDGAISSWIDDSGLNAYKVETNVHSLAVTGPVRVVKGASGIAGNGLNFNVGLCTNAPNPNDACGGTQVCCPTGTYSAGQCRANINQCYIDIPNSVYEWSFNTNLQGGPGVFENCDASSTPGCQTGSCAGGRTCDPGTCTCLPGAGDPCYATATSGPMCNATLSICAATLQCNTQSCLCEPESCAGYGGDECVDTEYCPNSPGSCSLHATGTARALGACDRTCATGTFSTILDRCTNSLSCDTTSSTQDILNRSITATCQAYNGQNRWIFSSNMSCPTGWTAAFGNRCVNLNNTCNLCASGLTCVNGQCAQTNEKCPGSAVCNASNQCEIPDSARCECCCRISNSAQDCCSPLECEGTCGNDTTDDSIGFGLCTGCADVGATTADHDAACNCTGSTGKYCDTSVPRGVCRDCSGLATSGECTNHITTCCFDVKNSQNNCRGGAGIISVPPADTRYGHCPYYNCTVPADGSCNTTGVLDSGDYRTTASCIDACRNITPAFGMSCRSTTNSSTSTCNTTICPSPFGCLNDDPTNNPLLPPTNCGICCCDPTAVVDPCTDLNPKLDCRENQAPCTSTNGTRGLCCGCTADTDCNNPPTPADAAGCGLDACCHARPEVLNTTPNDDATNICRNALLQAVFNQPMDVNSFTNNIIVFGDYNDSTCPAGTQFLTIGERKNIFVRAINKFFDIINKVIPAARAYTAALSTHNYCSVSGTVSGYNEMNVRSVMNFMPNTLFDGDRLYYLVIKGDHDLNSRNGVLNNFGVGMNEFVTASADYTFNGVTYPQSYIISFTTLSAQGPDNGICRVSRVDVQPPSYLFQTNINDSNEGDTEDTVADSDKIFNATARTADGQAIAPIPAVYNWTWEWNIIPNNNINIIPAFPADSTRQQARVVVTTTDGRATLHAVARITQDTVFNSPGLTTEGQSNLYILICDNPWPAIDPTSFSWYPWRDSQEGSACSVVGAGCNNTNYEVYYCRDAGQPGPYDDLPPMATDRAITRGASLICSDGITPCSVLGASCGGINICQYNVYKETYFLREATQTATTSMSVVASTTGGAVIASWPLIAGSDIDNYRLYWGTNSQSYPNWAEIGAAAGYTANNNVFCSINAGMMNCEVRNLTNGTTYYFNLTSYIETNTSGERVSTESRYYGEVRATPGDTVAPNSPVLTATPGDGLVVLNWLPVADVNHYRVYYGVNSGTYGNSEDLGTESRIVIRGLTNGRTYYFAVTAIDRSGNESSRVGVEQNARPESMIIIPAPTAGENILTWNISGSAANYVIYYEEIN